MIFQKTTFTRLFPVAPSSTGLMTYTSFGFESAGKRFYDVTVPGKPRIEQGMIVIALLETPNGFGGNGLLGWVDCHDGSIVCDSALKHFSIFLLSTFYAIMFPVRAYDVIDTPTNANLAAFVIAAMFGGFAFRFLYLSAKALLVKRALMTVRDLSKPNTAGSSANTAVERDASPQSGSPPHLKRQACKEFNVSTSTKDRTVAAATPVMVLAVSYAVAPWLIFLLPAALYFIYRKLSLDLSKDTSLKLFDLAISLALIGAATGAIIGSLSVVARDGEFTIPLVSSGLLTTILSIAATLYLAGASIRLSIKAFQEKAYSPKLSMGIFEALRGKRASKV